MVGTEGAIRRDSIMCDKKKNQTLVNLVDAFGLRMVISGERLWFGASSLINSLIQHTANIRDAGEVRRMPGTLLYYEVPEIRSVYQTYAHLKILLIIPL